MVWHIEMIQHASDNAQPIVFESGDDKLAWTFSLDLVDWWISVIDDAGDDDIPRLRLTQRVDSVAGAIWHGVLFAA